MPRTRPPSTSQDVKDISDVDQLLRYAIAGQLVPLERQRFTHEKIAAGAGLAADTRHAGSILAKILKGSERLTSRQLQGLDQVIGALIPNRDGAGGLSLLALRLGTGQNGEARGNTGEAGENTGEAGEDAAAKPGKTPWKHTSRRAGPAKYSQIRQPARSGS